MRYIAFLLTALLFASCSSPKYHNDYVAQGPVITKPLKVATIVIDPGHGGKDEGTHSNKPKYQEKHLALGTALALKKYLQGMGYRTIITRGDDTFVPLEARSCFANGNEADLFVSVHYNSAPSKSAAGIEIFYYQSDKDPVRSVESKVLADVVLGKILAQTQSKSRGVKHGNLSVIRETNMPAILVEGGFLSNEEERVKIMTDDYSKRLAWGMAVGIREYLRQSGS